MSDDRNLSGKKKILSSNKYRFSVQLNVCPAVLKIYMLKIINTL